MPADRPLLQFSLRQILTAMVGLAVGFALWRLPKAHWLDVPVAMVVLWMVGSLLGRALATKRQLAGDASLSREQRIGSWSLMFAVVGLAAAMLGVLLLRISAAKATRLAEGDFLLQLIVNTLLYDVLLVVMIASLAIGNGGIVSPRMTSRFSSFFSVVGVAGAWMGAILFALNFCCVAALVCIAIFGIEMAQSPDFVPESLDPDLGNRIRRFATLGLVGGILALVNTVFLAAACRMQSGGKKMAMVYALMIVGMIGQSYIAGWIIFKGFGQMSPAMTEGMGWPAIPIVVAVAILVVIFSAMIAARFSVTVSPVAVPPELAMRKRFPHESWQGAFVVGLLATAIYFSTVIGAYLELRRQLALVTFIKIDYLYLLDLFFSSPTRLIELAAMIAGFSLAWRRWRNRSSPNVDVLPSVKLSKFIGITVAVCLFLLITAPIVAAIGLSFWLLPSR